MVRGAGTIAIRINPGYGKPNLMQDQVQTSFCVITCCHTYTDPIKQIGMAFFTPAFAWTPISSSTDCKSLGRCKAPLTVALPRLTRFSLHKNLLANCLTHSNLIICLPWLIFQLLVFPPSTSFNHSCLSSTTLPKDFERS